MITLYTKSGDQIIARAWGPDIVPGDSIVWIDVLQPSADDYQVLSSHFGLETPHSGEHWKNQSLNRLYIDGHYAYMNAALITKVDSPYPGTAPVTFILGPQFLVTLHTVAPTSFKNFAARLQKNPGQFPNSMYVLEGLLEEIITRVAYNSEIVMQTLDDLSHDIFGEVLDRPPKKRQAQSTSSALQGVLKRLGSTADLNSKINESLHSLNRLLMFFRQEISEDPRVDAKIDTLLTDIYTLTTQTAFLSDKVTFQLDATLGMINVEQNVIIKIFSMVAVFFLPPTLITSMYGMNFRFMPELEWAGGYPVALFMMFLSAAIPFYYFRRRGWM